MQCPQCGTANPHASRFCNQCGAGLHPTQSGPDVHSELLATRDAVRRLRRYIPAAVADGILHDQERLRGERRAVTVLFADMVGFTHLSASLDAEPVFRLINDLLGRLMACIHRYDGVVDRLTGDGLIAVFGAPIAHENDAELAVRAALDMQRTATGFAPIARAQLGAPLKIRIGLHSGPAIAGIIGTEQQAAYTVIGETVNLAARLESMARPGHILVSSRVHQQTGALFNFQPMDTIQVKGFDEPVAVYEAVEDRTEPLPTRGVTGVTTLLLGRDNELGQLRAQLEGFQEDEKGRLVVVEGEAGLGKSRLIAEALSTSLSDRTVAWYGRSLPYAQGVAYAMFRSLLSDALRAQSLALAWDAQVSPGLRPALRHMLGLELSAQELARLRALEPGRVKQLTALALREWLLGEASVRPIVLILEDYHWADDLSRDLLDSLVGILGQAPVFLCVITRPQSILPQHPDLPPIDATLDMPASVHLKLGPLSAEHGRALLGHLVELDALPEQLIDTILTRAEGNPLYIEEFVRMMIEKEVLALGDGQWQVVSDVALRALEIPTSLRGLMLARVDRLPEDLQQVLRTAAVIGMQFSARLLDEVERRIRGSGVAAPVLQRLTDLGMLVQRPDAGEGVYAFRSILNQETVYESLLRSQRPALHRAVAESIETLYADSMEQQVEVLALHYDRARVRNKAMAYTLQAGDRARGRFANREAIEYYGRALQLSQHLSDCQMERFYAIVGLGEIHQHIGEYEEAVACYEAGMLDWDEAVPDARARVRLRLGQVWDKRGDLQQAKQWLQDGLAQIGQANGGLTAVRAQILSELGWLSLRRGDLAAAQEQLEHGLALVSENTGTEDYDVLASILNRLGAVHYHRSEWGAAVANVEQALELRERLGDVVGYARSLNNLAILKEISGDWDAALAHYQRAVDTYERIGEVEGLAGACTNMGVLYTERGDWHRAAAHLQRSFAIAQRIAHPYELGQAHMNLGRLYLLQGGWEAAAQHLNTAIPLYEDAGARASLNLNRAYILQGTLSLEQGDVEAAQGWAQRSFGLLNQVSGGEQESSVEWGLYQQLMGRLAQASGDTRAALDHLQHSAAVFSVTGSELEAGRTAYWSGLLYLEQAETQHAVLALDTAREVFERLGAGADLRRVDTVRVTLTL